MGLSSAQNITLFMGEISHLEELLPKPGWERPQNGEFRRAWECLALGRSKAKVKSIVLRPRRAEQLVLFKLKV